MSDTESMTSVEFVEMVDRFLKHPVFTEQEAMIVAALYEGKINKQTAGQLLIKVAEHNISKLNELFSMDANQLQKLIEEVA
jgi:hypothetical protein